MVGSSQVPILCLRVFVVQPSPRYQGTPGSSLVTHEPEAPASLRHAPPFLNAAIFAREFATLLTSLTDDAATKGIPDEAGASG